MPDLSSRPMLALAAVAVVVAIAGGAYFGRTPAPPPPPAPVVASITPELIVVHVSGAVANPGLVSLLVPARIADAVEAAGGATAAADLGALNLAGPAGDGDQIIVPTYGEQTKEESGLVDINRATTAELTSLAGIGPVLADRIVAYRDENGRFEAIEDLLDVPGIGEAKLALMRPGMAPP